MKRNGFVLMETIIVIVVISVALLTIFASYNKILTKVKKENKYDTSEYIYMTNYVKKYLKNLEKNSTDTCIRGTNKIIYEFGEKDEDELSERSKSLKNYFSTNSCGFSNSNQFNIKGIYLLKYLNEIDEDENNLDLFKFNANMIDYIRKLDVGDNDILLVVEYDRVALDDKGNPIYTTSCPEGGKDSNNNDCEPLTETYIASLEWE